MTFHKLGLREELLLAINAMGFTTPMPIQAAAIPTLLKSPTDFVGLAQTGTGKTGAFGLPILQRIDPAVKTPQAIILCPTRELCLQIVEETRSLARFIEGIRITPVYGGASINQQITELRGGVQVVVATPGRLLDLIKRKAINLTQTSVAVLDEADEMLDMGFEEDLEQIMAALPAERNVWMFSATMGRNVEAIAKRYLNSPAEVTIGTRNQSGDNIAHHCYTVSSSHRYAGLRRIIDMNPDMYALIFRRTRHSTQELGEMLARDGYGAEPLHGDMTQAQREQVMKRFRRGQTRLLVATDVAARGIDVDDITHIIHFDLPDDIDVYTHRSGRTARAGKSGCSVVLAAPSERHRIMQIERRLKIEFISQQIPSGKDVQTQRLVKVMRTLASTTIDNQAIEELFPLIDEQLKDLSREDLIKCLLTIEIQRIKGSHLTHQNLNAAFHAPSHHGKTSQLSRKNRRIPPSSRFKSNRKKFRDKGAPSFKGSPKFSGKNRSKRKIVNK